MKKTLLSLIIFSTLHAEYDMKKLQAQYAKPIEQWPKPTIDQGIHYNKMRSLKSENKTELAMLGLRFFHEPRFSKSMIFSCASCHTPNKAFSEHTKVSTGHKGLKGGRNSPTLYGAKEGKFFFWDGRAKSLEEQALGPIQNPIEMALPLNKLKKRLKTMTGYEKDLKKVFGTSDFTLKRLATAIAAYERIITPPRTKFDTFLDGDTNAFNPEELLGLHLFRTKARCMNCHSGRYLSDGAFHNLGLTYYKRKKYEDFGRYNVTKLNTDMGKFKTPTLRQISNTYPYMHNGLFTKLSGIINMYNNGMPNIKKKTVADFSDPHFPKKSNLLKKLDLSKKEKKALEAFLRTL